MSDSYSPQKKCPPGFYSRSSSSIEVSRKQCKPSVDNKSSSGILAPKWDPKPVPSPTAKKRVDAVDLYVVSEVRRNPSWSEATAKPSYPYLASPPT
jgi:hypothetical protein